MITVKSINEAPAQLVSDSEGNKALYAPKRVWIKNNTSSITYTTLANGSIIRTEKTCNKLSSILYK